MLPKFALLMLALFAGCATAPPPEAPVAWWKGNLHTHSLWTDGADYPEMIAAWYKEHGYHFLGITEHDMLQEGGDRWLDINAPDAGWPPRNASARAALPGYRERFGAAAVDQREVDGKQLVRLRPLNEYRARFEEPGRFLLLMGEEITDKGGAHLNAFNLDAAVLPQGGATSAARIRNNLEAVAERRRLSARPILTIVNHPNYVWTLRAEEVAAIPDARHFEVYNGHTMTNSAGDSTHPSTDAMWDIMLTLRHQAGGAPIYGVATDDAHEYRTYNDTISRPGRGWVMVRAARLRTEELINALAAGDFYATTGVLLHEIEHDVAGVRVRIQSEPGVTYRTTFIGTRRDSDAIGEVLAEVAGDVAHYAFKGNERYVRARIVSSKPQLDALDGRVIGRQTAWIQPVMR